MNNEAQTLIADPQGASMKDFVEGFVRKHDIQVIKMGAVDIDGLWRGKRLSADYFVKAAHEAGSNICNILFGWDINDESIPLVTYTGFHTGYPDVNLRPDLSTLRLSPDEPGTAMVIADIYDQEGNLLPLAPRTILRNTVNRARKLGYDPIAAYEYEFYLFEGTPRENARRGWRDMEPFTVGSHTYSVYRDTGSEFLLATIRRRLAEQGIFIEASNSEHGPGQFEVNIHYGDALKAADDALVLKHTVKEVAAERGYTATFMAKINRDHAGSSGHVHQSLNRTADGEAAFANPANPKDLSEVGQAYLAGLVASSKELAALFLPTINSYKRLKGEQWAGSSATWGYDNRTVAIRSIPSAGRAARVENRTPGADANPYLVVAAGLAAGLNGIERGLTAPEPVIGNAYAMDFADDVRLPATLGQAVETFENSDVAKEYFGEEFVRHYAQTRRWEIQNHEAAVTDWEVNRYIEHI
jgi:glutamine synthetase